MAEIVEKQGVAALADLMAHTPIFPAWQIAAYPTLNEDFLAVFRHYDPKALALILRGAKLCNLLDREKLMALMMSALILAWVGDSGHPISSAEEVVRLLPDSRLVIAQNMDGVGAWTKEIRGFISLA